MDFFLKKIFELKNINEMKIKRKSITLILVNLDTIANPQLLRCEGAHVSVSTKSNLLVIAFRS